MIEDFELRRKNQLSVSLGDIFEVFEKHGIPVTDTDELCNDLRGHSKPAYEEGYRDGMRAGAKYLQEKAEGE